MESRYRPGTIVSARGREWIVLPPREPEVMRLRPVTTAQGDEVGLFLPLEGERVRSARFNDPEPQSGGDATGIMTLFDAARLSLRSGAGPFRSFGHISVVPRPYQFVPLIMSLRQSPVRLLIADDVGVGKTIEAAMIARELLDRSLARRLAVLCPAHLCDQWERALREKFAIEAALATIENAFPAALRRQAIAEGAYRVEEGRIQAAFLEEPSTAVKALDAVGDLDRTDDDAALYFRPPDPETKLAFAEWIAAPQRRDRATFAAFGPILDGLRASLSQQLQRQNPHGPAAAK